MAKPDAEKLEIKEKRMVVQRNFVYDLVYRGSLIIQTGVSDTEDVWITWEDKIPEGFNESEWIEELRDIYEEEEALEG